MNINGEDWLLIISIAYCTILILAWAYFHVSSRMRERKAAKDAKNEYFCRVIARNKRRKRLYANWGIDQ